MNNKNAVKRTSSPVLELEITKENYDRAVKASSGACLFADDIKAKYSQFTNIEVDVATTRISDKAAGVRYIYLTPRVVGDALLHFDQGWVESELPKKFVIRQAVKIVRIIRNPTDLKASRERRKIRLAELEAKDQRGENLTAHEKSTLTKLRNPKEVQKRPANFGSATVIGTGRNLIVKGGVPLKTPKNPNLLAGRTRHFGAKTAKPSEVFEQAVQQAVKERLEEVAAREEEQATLAEVTAS